MKTSLRKTLITTTAATLSLVSVGMIAVVAYLQLNLSQSQLESDEALITEALESKGKILSSSHALALRGFVEANAISDVRDMVTRAVKRTRASLYGLFLMRTSIPGLIKHLTPPKVQARGRHLVYLRNFSRLRLATVNYRASNKKFGSSPKRSSLKTKSSERFDMGYPPSQCGWNSIARGPSRKKPCNEHSSS